MKFTVERAALVKMLELVGKQSPGRKSRDKEVRLSACAARVFVEANETVAGIEALVLADGTCLLPHDVFLKLLKTYAPKPHIAVEADGRGIRFCSTTLPVLRYSRVATPPGKFQVFPVTDLDVLQSEPEPSPIAQPAAVPVPEPETPPPAVCTTPGCFPIADDEMHLVAEIIRLTRRVCSLPATTPEQLVGLAHALYAFARLPRISKGIHVEFSLATRLGTDDDYSEISSTFSISEAAFDIGTVYSVCDPDLGSDHPSIVTYQVESNGFRSTPPGDAEAWAQIRAWIKEFDELLAENDPGDLRLYVTDHSALDCMAPEEGK